jgi:hypothetical protein
LDCASPLALYFPRLVHKSFSRQLVAPKRSEGGAKERAKPARAASSRNRGSDVCGRLPLTFIPKQLVEILMPLDLAHLLYESRPISEEVLRLGIVNQFGTS